jgi:hypothetical protein
MLSGAVVATQDSWTIVGGGIARTPIRYLYCYFLQAKGPRCLANILILIGAGCADQSATPNQPPQFTLFLGALKAA